MSRIPVLNETTSTGAAIPILTSLKERMGKVFNFHGTVANSPAALQAFMEYDRLLDEHGTLSMQEKEAIALVAGEYNQSSYCLGVHTMISGMAGISGQDALEFRKGTPADPRLRALCGFVRKVLETRGGVSPADLQELRSAGYDDARLVEIHAHLMKQQWTNYLSRTFGVELDVPPAPALGADEGAFEISELIPGSPKAIYEAWLDGKAHSAMTGGKATVEPKVGGRHSAWDGMISGSNLELEPGRRIVQSWRTNDFPKEAPDSRLEVRLEPAAGGTKVTIAHGRIPQGQTEWYRKGWGEHYFEPMKRYFSNPKSH